MQERQAMPITVTAVYENADQVINAFDDLVSTGIPREKIFADRDHAEVKVATPQTAVPEIEEILRRHRPTDMYHTPLPAS